MTRTRPIISIENVVATATIEQRLDLKEITKKFPEVEWHPDLFPGAVFRLKNPKTATLINLSTPACLWSLNTVKLDACLSAA